MGLSGWSMEVLSSYLHRLLGPTQIVAPESRPKQEFADVLSPALRVLGRELLVTHRRRKPGPLLPSPAGRCHK